MQNDICFMYTGQGSQYFGMCKKYYGSDEVFTFWMNKLDRIAFSKIGDSIIRYLYEEPNELNVSCDAIEYTHTAICMVEYSMTKSLESRGITPKMLLGSSLGELICLAVAEVLPIEDLIEYLIEQAFLLKKECAIGGMLAIAAEYSSFDANILDKYDIDISSIDYDKHFVVSGGADSIMKFKKYLNEKDINFWEIPVQYGFHSRAIDSIYQKFMDRLKDIGQLKDAKIPILSCSRMEEVVSYQHNDLWSILRKPIKFQETVKKYLSDDTILIDVGPSGTLAGFSRKILKNNNNIFGIISQFHTEEESVNKIVRQLDSLNIDDRSKNVVAYVFPGQGSQSVGMGKEYFDEFEELIDLANKILGYSVKELCLENPDNKLNLTQYTQPALYVVNAMAYLKTIQETGKKPEYVAGHSLGEYSALFAAEVFDFETGLRLVSKRGELMGTAENGGMAAVIGLDETAVKKVFEDFGFDNIDIANLNSPEQIVITGRKSDIEKAQAAFEEAGAKLYVILNVSGAFHSRYMEEAKKEFAKYIEQFEFKEPRITVISNVYARPYNFMNLKSTLSSQITSSVRWCESIRYLWGKGDPEIIQIGPGRVLADLTNKIKCSSSPLKIDDELQNQFVKSNVMTEKNAVIEKKVNVLGNSEFIEEYGLKYAYVVGPMCNGISSVQLIEKAAKSGLLAYYATEGLTKDKIVEDIAKLNDSLKGQHKYGVAISMDYMHAMKEIEMFSLIQKHDVTMVQLSGYISVSESIIRFKAAGVYKDGDTIKTRNRIMVKLSRPEVAITFLKSAPNDMIEKLFSEGKITALEAEFLRNTPLADAICVETNSAGKTDNATAFSTYPSILRMKNRIMEEYKYNKDVYVGYAGSIGSPEAIVAAFVMGADFIMTGSINQCCVEAGTSDKVKDMLQEANIQDTDYIPSGDNYDFVTKTQVLKKGVLFHVRANKLYEIYKMYPSIDDIDITLKRQIEQQFFSMSLDDVYRIIEPRLLEVQLKKAEKMSKYKMALIFNYYYVLSMEKALKGKVSEEVNYLVHCSVAMGAFNLYVKDTKLEKWKFRYVDEIAIMLMEGAETMLKNKVTELMKRLEV